MRLNSSIVLLTPIGAKNRIVRAIVTLMDPRYIVTIRPAEASSPDAGASPRMFRTRFDVGAYDVTVVTMTNLDADLLDVEEDHERGRLTITEGCIVPSRGPGLLQSGSYNQLIVDAVAGEVTLHNDTLGVLPVYFSTGDGILRISNSLRLLRQAAGLSLDELGVAETFLFGGWAIYERTILKDCRRAAAGTMYRFRREGSAEPAATRLSENWTTTFDDSPRTITERFIALWETALQLHFAPVDSPVGIFLSGGLDSRLVAGGLASLGKKVIGVTHGDPQSDEVRIAGEVAEATGAQWISSAIDDTFPFERLVLDRVHMYTEALANPMWDSSGRYLAEKGATNFTTGAGFDLIFGGRVDANKRVRLLKNIQHSILGAKKLPPLTPQDVAALAESFTNQARKRARLFSFIVAEPYRELFNDSLPAIHDDVAARISDTARTTPTLPQLYERFMCDHRVRQFTTMQERQLIPFGKLLLPTYDRDLLAYITNLPPELKYDHYLYYPAFRRLYPKLARIQVPNLGTGIDKPQLLIELTRAMTILRRKRLSPWVNFEEWIRASGRLDQLESRFLAAAHFFDPDGVRAYFNDVRAGRRRIYDGNEVFSFLSLAMLLDEGR